MLRCITSTYYYKAKTERQVEISHRLANIVIPSALPLIWQEYLCVSLCVWERERENKTKQKTKSRHIWTISGAHLWACVYMVTDWISLTTALEWSVCDKGWTAMIKASSNNSLPCADWQLRWAWAWSGGTLCFKVQPLNFHKLTTSVVKRESQHQVGV